MILSLTFLKLCYDSQLFFASPIFHALNFAAYKNYDKNHLCHSDFLMKVYSTTVLLWSQLESSTVTASISGFPANRIICSSDCPQKYSLATLHECKQHNYLHTYHYYNGWLGLNGTFSTNRLYPAITVG